MSTVNDKINIKSIINFINIYGAGDLIMFFVQRIRRII
jgi:hypothetical protein